MDGRLLEHLPGPAVKAPAVAELGVPGVRRRRRGLRISYRDARVQAIVCAAVLWVSAVAMVLSGEGYRASSGRLKGADFVHFYTLGAQFLTGRSGELYDAVAQQAFQQQLVPQATERYLPIYPPQAALLFLPFAALPYGVAALLWGLTNVLLYGVIVWSVWHAIRRVLPDGVFVAASAAAFAPFWNLVLYGQTTIVPLVAFYLGWRALAAQRPYLAGLALGLLALKPQFGLVLAVVVLACREWRMLAGALTSAALQAAVVAALMGFGVLYQYVLTLMSVGEVAHLLEPNPAQMHSVRAVTSLLPSAVGLPLWTLVSAGILWLMVTLWRSSAGVDVKMGLLVLATILVNPHVTVYDATVLALPLLWLGGWTQRRSTHQGFTATRFWYSVYLLCATLLLPTAYLIHVQASVLVMGDLFYQMVRAARGGREAANPVERPLAWGSGVS